MQYDVTIYIGLSEEPWADAGVIYRGGRDILHGRGDDGYEGYYAGVRIDGNLVLGMVNGVFTTLNSTPLRPGFNPGERHRMRIIAEGSKIIIDVNGQTMIQHHDSMYSSGWTGLRVHRVSANFDDLRILNFRNPEGNSRPVGPGTNVRYMAGG